MTAAITLAVEEEYNEILQHQKEYEEDLQNMSAGYRPSDDTAIEDLGIDESTPTCIKLVYSHHSYQHFHRTSTFTDKRSP